MAEKKEAVSYPQHYNKGIEVITFIESWELNFSRGSAVKYICRAGLKDDSTAKEIEDLKKAQQYLQFEIDRIERETSAILDAISGFDEETEGAVHNAGN